MNSRVAAAGGPPELRRLARSFNEMADNVEEVLEQQRAFVADASHQLRNPLAALLLRIELLALELPEGNEEIASVRTEGKRLAQVLDDLLDLALAEHAAADLRLTDIGELAAERVAAWRPLAEEKGVRLTGHCAAVTAWADPVALSSALDAVIDNALKFTPAGRGGHGLGRLQRRDLHRRGHRRRPRPDRRGAGPYRRPLLAQRPPPERQGLGPRACPSRAPCWRRAAARSRTRITSRAA